MVSRLATETGVGARGAIHPEIPPVAVRLGVKPPPGPHFLLLLPWPPSAHFPPFTRLSSADPGQEGWPAQWGATLGQLFIDPVEAADGDRLVQATSGDYAFLRSRTSAREARTAAAAVPRDFAQGPA